MPRRTSRATVSALAWVLVLAGSVRSRAQATDPDLVQPLEQAMAAAESSLRDGKLELAQDRYRSALVEGWLLRGSLEAADGRLTEAKECFGRASALGEAGAPRIEPSSLSSLAPSARLELSRRVTAALARAYLNLGVMDAQRRLFSRAVLDLEAAAELDPDLPQIQYSLGVACFNAQQFDKATGPLARALRANPADAGLKRMLAMAWLETEAYAKAAELLRDDPERDANPSLQYAYGLALVRSERAAEAEAVFAKLLARHGDTPELNVLLGQAHAQQGDYDAAIQSLRRALAQKPDVADANTTLGILYLKRGQLAEAEEALRAELQAHPADVKARFTLATVVDLEGRPEEALVLLRAVLEARPDFADALYLKGKVLLAKGAAAEAVVQLEAAARLSPEDANIRYQLGQAFQKLGRTEAAQEQFEAFRRLKDKRRVNHS